MLTQQHRFANQILHPQRQRAYKTHMCGLCHALGDNYGLPFRLLTSHEMILLNLLVTAQQETEPEIVPRRCPLNPLKWVATNQDAAAQFAAATAVGLAQVSLDDKIWDAGGCNSSRRQHYGSHLPAYVGRWFLAKPYRLALALLKRLGLATETLTGLGLQQSLAENDETQDPTRPTAEASAQLFAMTARLAGQPTNEATLARLGASYGAYIYLMDAYRDFPEDMRNDHYNPLRRFCQQREEIYSLSSSGLQWLLERFKQLRTDIQAHLKELQLYRHETLLVELLTGPLTHMIEDLSYQTLHQRDRSFRLWRAGDLLKTAFFFTPASLLFYDCDCDCGGGDNCDCGSEINPCACVDFSCQDRLEGSAGSWAQLCFVCGDCWHTSDSSTGSSTAGRRKKK
jgi:hypothetical protein